MRCGVAHLHERRCQEREGTGARPKPYIGRYEIRSARPGAPKRRQLRSRASRPARWPRSRVARCRSTWGVGTPPGSGGRHDPGPACRRQPGALRAPRPPELRWRAPRSATNARSPSALSQAGV